MAKILIIDDEAVVVQTLCTLLKSEGHDVVPVYQGSHAIPTIDRVGHVDLILVDIRMSPVDGLEVIMRARKSRPQMPIIVVSAYLDDRMIEKIKRLGATSYIKKPFTVNEVLDAVQGVLGNGK